MRIIVLALLVALAFGTASAAPLQGSDGNATVVFFGSSRTPLDDENATQEILKVDVGIVGADNATYQLVDADGNIYLPGLYKPLSSGKQTVYFLTAKDSLFKLVNVTPKGGVPIYINWWATPKGGNDNLVVRYYGITDWLINPDEQGIVVQVRVQNNGTQNLYVSPENFTLLDQWGWPYRPSLGFDAEIVGPNNATSDRVLLGFTGVSLFSRPAALAYDYMTSNQVIIEFERDYVPLSDELVWGAGGKPSTSTATVEPATAAADAPQASEQTAPSETVQAPTQQNASSKIGSIKERVAASQARLAATRAELDEKTPESTANSTANSTASSALNNSASVSA